MSEVGEGLFSSEASESVRYTYVAAGNYFTCGVKADGLIVCWGDDDDGQTSPPDGVFASVSAGDYYTCGVRSDGGVECWGKDYAGETSSPDGVFASVSAGVLHSCGVRTDGAVECWGSDYYGQSLATGRKVRLCIRGRVPHLWREVRRCRRVLGLGQIRSILAARRRLCNGVLGRPLRLRRSGPAALLNAGDSANLTRRLRRREISNPSPRASTTSAASKLTVQSNVGVRILGARLPRLVVERLNPSALEWPTHVA